jgi:hypothetical protein
VIDLTTLPLKLVKSIRLARMSANEDILGTLVDDGQD